MIPAGQIRDYTVAHPMPGVLRAAEGLFVRLFFAAVGLHLDFSFTALPLQAVGALSLIPLAGKLAGAFIGTHVARRRRPCSLPRSSTGSPASSRHTLDRRPAAPGRESVQRPWRCRANRVALRQVAASMATSDSGLRLALAHQ